MFNFLTPSYWQFNGPAQLLTDAVDAVKAIPAFVSEECERYDITPASVVSAAATQAVQAVSSTAHFTMAATSSLLNLAWSGLSSHGPPLAQGMWNGLTTYGPPLAEGVWTGLKTYGPPTAMAVGKGAVWTGTNAWEAARWGSNALATAAQEHHVKERALETGKALLTEARAGWELLSGKGIDLGPLDIGSYGAVAIASPQQAVPADHSSAQVLPMEPMAALDPAIAVDAPQVWHGSGGMLDDLDQEYGPLAASDMAPDTGQSDVWHTARSHWSQDPEFSPGAMHCHTEMHLHVHITGAMPSTCVPFPAG